MAGKIYLNAIRGIMAGEIDLNADTFKAALVMTNTTVDTEDAGKVNLADFTTLDECDAGGYARVTLANLSVAIDSGNSRVEWDFDDFSFASLVASAGDNASRQAQGVLIYKHVDGTNANDIAVAYSAFQTNKAVDATQIDVTVNAEGAMQGSDATV